MDECAAATYSGVDCFAEVIATSNQYWREVLALFWEQALYY